MHYRCGQRNSTLRVDLPRFRSPLSDVSAHVRRETSTSWRKSGAARQSGTCSYMLRAPTASRACSRSSATLPATRRHHCPVPTGTALVRCEIGNHRGTRDENTRPPRGQVSYYIQLHRTLSDLHCSILRRRAIPHSRMFRRVHDLRRAPHRQVLINRCGAALEEWPSSPEAAFGHRCAERSAASGSAVCPSQLPMRHFRGVR